MSSKPRGGRPSKYKGEYAEQAKKLCALGATDDDLADFFKVTVRTIHNWKTEHEEFFHSLKGGKEAADEAVERSLYHRAVGYEVDSVKIFMPSGAEEPVYAEYRERIPPDTTAAIFWLKNRRPEAWKDRREVEGMINVSVNFEERLRSSIQRVKMNGSSHPDADTGRAASGPHSVIRQ